MPNISLDALPSPEQLRANSISLDQLPSPDQLRPKAKAPDVSKSEAALRGYGQGATFGFGDELAGGLEAGLFAPIHSLVAGEDNFGDQGHFGALTNIPENYRRARDTMRAQNDAALEAHPYLYRGSEFVGAIPTAVATAGGGEAAAAEGEAATLGQRMAAGAIQGAKAGAKSGAVLGLGASKADLTDPSLQNYGQAALDTAAGSAVGAGTGGVVGGAAPVASDLAGGLKNYFNKKANAFTFDALGPTAKQMRKFGGPEGDKAQEVAQLLRDEGISGPLTSRKGMLRGVQNLNDETGQEIGGIISKADAANAEALPEVAPKEYFDPMLGRVQKPGTMTTPIDVPKEPLGERFISVDDFANQVKDRIVKPLQKVGEKSSNSAAGEINSQLEALKAAHGEKGYLTFQETQTILKSLRDSEKLFDKSGGAAELRALKGYYGEFRGAQSNALDALGKEEGLQLSEPFKQNLNKYHLGQTAEDVLSGKVAREAAGRTIGPGTHAAALAGEVASGGAGGGAAAAAAYQGMLRYGNQLGAAGFGGAEGLSKLGQGILQNGGGNASVVPAYQLLYEKLKKEEENQ